MVTDSTTQPLFVISKSIYDPMVLLYGLISSHIVQPIQEELYRPLVVFDFDHSFQAFSSTFSSHCDLVKITEVVNNPNTPKLNKRVTFIDIEALRQEPEKYSRALENLKAILIQHKAAVLVTQAWKVPKSFLSWLVKQSEVSILGIAIMNPSDISDCWPKELIHYRAPFMDCEKPVFPN